VADLWPWLVVAGLGALHGSSPTTGWMFAAACGVRARDAAQARRALLPIAVGHAASVVAVGFAVAQGIGVDRASVRSVAGALLVVVAANRALRGGRRRRPSTEPSGGVAIAGWSFLMATAHGAGLMLVPAFAPLCFGEGPVREIAASGSPAMAAAAVVVHTTAMLLTTGAIAGGVCRGVMSSPRGTTSPALGRAWTATLAATGALLLTLR